MDVLFILAVVVVALVIGGILLGHLTWERGITLILVTAIVIAVIYLLLAWRGP
jgi:hypothetical protein